MYLKAWIDREARSGTNRWLLWQFETAQLEESYHQMRLERRIICELDLQPRRWREKFDEWRSSQPWAAPDRWSEGQPTAQTLADIWRSIMLGREPREGEE